MASPILPNHNDMKLSEDDTFLNEYDDFLYKPNETHYGDEEEDLESADQCSSPISLPPAKRRMKQNEDCGAITTEQVKEVASFSSLSSSGADSRNDDGNVSSNVQERMDETELRDKNKDEAFPYVLMKMINDIRGRDCVQWTKDGNSFIVTSHDKIEQDLLKVYFSSFKYTSFRRKLNRWGFRSEKIEVEGLGKQRAFFHKFFRRDDTSMLKYMGHCKLASSRTAKEAAKLKAKPNIVATTTTATTTGSVTLVTRTRALPMARTLPMSTKMPALPVPKPTPAMPQTQLLRVATLTAKPAAKPIVVTSEPNPTPVISQSQQPIEPRSTDPVAPARPDLVASSRASTTPPDTSTATVPSGNAFQADASPKNHNLCSHISPIRIGSEEYKAGCDRESIEWIKHVTLDSSPEISMKHHDAAPDGEHTHGNTKNGDNRSGTLSSSPPVIDDRQFANFMPDYMFPDHVLTYGNTSTSMEHSQNFSHNKRKYQSSMNDHPYNHHSFPKLPVRAPSEMMSPYHHSYGCNGVMTIHARRSHSDTFHSPMNSKPMPSPYRLPHE